MNRFASLLKDAVFHINKVDNDSSLRAQHGHSYELQRQQLLRAVSRAVKQVQLEYAAQVQSNEAEEVTIHDGKPAFQLCSCCEIVLRHGLKEGFISFGAKPSFWSLAQRVSRKQAIEYIYSLQNAKSNMGRCRAWLRLAVNENSLQSYITTVLSDMSLLGYYYDRHAFLMDIEKAEAMAKMISGVAFFSFAISVDTPALEFEPTPLARMWEPLAKVQFPQQRGKQSQHNDIVVEKRARRKGKKKREDAALQVAPVLGNSVKERGTKESLPICVSSVSPPSVDEEQPTMVAESVDSEESGLFANEFANEESWFQELIAPDKLEKADSEYESESLAPSEPRSQCAEDSAQPSSLETQSQGEEVGSLDLDTQTAQMLPESWNSGKEEEEEEKLRMEDTKSVDSEKIGISVGNDTGSSQDQEGCVEEENAEIDSEVLAASAGVSPNESLPLPSGESQSESSASEAEEGAVEEQPVTEEEGGGGIATPVSEKSVECAGHVSDMQVKDAVAVVADDERDFEASQQSFGHNDIRRYWSMNEENAQNEEGEEEEEETEEEEEERSQDTDEEQTNGTESVNEESEMGLGLESAAILPDVPTWYINETQSQAIDAEVEATMKELQLTDSLDMEEITKFDENYFSQPELLGPNASSEELKQAVRNRVSRFESGEKLTIKMKEKLVREIVQLRLQIQELKESSGLLESRVVLGHKFTRKGKKPGAQRYCDHCRTTIWRLVQAWYRCSGCSYNCHRKCLANVSRPCPLTQLPGSNFVVDVCPERTLSDQQYKCLECRRNIAIMPRGGISEARLCDYNGCLYCDNCHWNDTSIIPARVIHNWDFTPYRICRHSLQLISLRQTHASLNIQETNSLLFNYVTELAEMRRLREEILVMKKYFVSCKEALNSRLLNLLQERQHFKESSELYSLQDLIDLSTGQLIREISDIHRAFAKHIRTDCQLCQAKGFICEICKADHVIFHFDIDAAMCPDCSTVFHRACLNSNQCPKCLRISQRRQSQH